MLKVFGCFAMALFGIQMSHLTLKDPNYPSKDYTAQSAPFTHKCSLPFQSSLHQRYKQPQIILLRATRIRHGLDMLI